MLLSTESVKQKHVWDGLPRQSLVTERFTVSNWARSKLALALVAEPLQTLDLVSAARHAREQTNVHARAGWVRGCFFFWRAADVARLSCVWVDSD